MSLKKGRKTKDAERAKEQSDVEAVADTWEPKNASKFDSTISNAFTIRRLPVPQFLPQIDNQSNNPADEPQHEILLDLGERSIPSSIGLTMLVRSQPSLPPIPLHPPDDLDPDSEHINPLSKKERNKQQSLKNLSLMVKEFLGQHKDTTYKAMAETLIKRFGHNDQSKDNQNLKRRVYDSINVMVALGVLEKNRKIITKGPMFEQNYIHNHYGKEVLDKLNQQKYELLGALMEKRRLFKDWTKKIRALEALVDQNKTTLAADLYLHPDSLRKYPFPLVLFYQKRPENTLIHFNPQRTEITFKSKDPIKVLGDFDFVVSIPRLRDLDNCCTKPKQTEHIL